MTGTSAGDLVGRRENRVLDADTEADLCEACYQFVVKYGLENVLVCLGRAARLRASDYIHTSRRLYLRYQRASSMIVTAFHEILDDTARVEEILDQEQASDSPLTHEFLK
jgi:hypothetical protein